MTAITDPARTRDRSIPSLDGLRALSIALVLFSHHAGTRGAPFPDSINEGLEWGMLGVRVFFVISGFLITTLLLAETDRTSTIDLRTFYRRRALRIFPPYFAYLACLALFAAIGWVEVPAGSFVRAATFVSNYSSALGWHLGHTWSLSVEEQFYLLWPAALLLAGRRRGWMVALAVVLTCPMIRVAEYHLLGESLGISHRFETTADALAIGCLLAYVRPWLGTNAFYARVRASGAPYLLPLVILGGASLGRHPHLEYMVGIPVANLSIALLIDWTVRTPSTVLGRLLNTAPLAFVGRMSYSLYLWQQPFLNRGSSAWFAASRVNLLCAVFVGALSYALIEQPTLRLRHRLDQSRRDRARAAMAAPSRVMLPPSVGLTPPPAATPTNR